MESHRHGVVLGHFAGVRGYGEGAGDTVLDGGAGSVFGTADGNLDDAVGLGFGEAPKGGVQSLGGCHVEGRVGELAFFGAVEHLCVYFGSCDTHEKSP